MEILITIIIAAAAVAAVLYPLVRGDGRGVPLEVEEHADGPPEDVDAEIARYRASLRAGTLCRACGRANAEGSRFCAECGRALAVARVRRARGRAARTSKPDRPADTNPSR